MYGDRLARLRPDVVLSCGDLPFDYVEFIVSRADVPLLYVLGNHDPGLAPADSTWAPLRTEAPVPGPQGCDNADGRVLEVSGLRIGGLGVSIRYKPGPNQYTQAQMRRRALALELRARLRRVRGGRKLDILLTHARPAAAGPRRTPRMSGLRLSTGSSRRWAQPSTCTDTSMSTAAANRNGGSGTPASSMRCRRD